MVVKEKLIDDSATTHFSVTRVLSYFLASTLVRPINLISVCYTVLTLFSVSHFIIEIYPSL